MYKMIRVNKDERWFVCSWTSRPGSKKVHILQSSLSRGFSVAVKVQKRRQVCEKCRMLIAYEDGTLVPHALLCRPW